MVLEVKDTLRVLQIDNVVILVYLRLPEVLPFGLLTIFGPSFDFEVGVNVAEEHVDELVLILVPFPLQLLLFHPLILDDGIPL